MRASHLRLGVLIIACALTIHIDPSIAVRAGQKKSARAAAKERPLSPTEVFLKAWPSLVVVLAQDESGQVIAQGSGFFIEPGLVATSLHLFKNAHRGYTKLTKAGTQHEIDRVKMIDRENDLCVFSVKGLPTRRTSKGALAPMQGKADLSGPPSLSLAWKEQESQGVIVFRSGVRIGEEVFVASNPLGLEATFSKGTFTGVRNNPSRFQIDAAISPGSSGGPVLNNRGEVIGIVSSSIRSGQNLNFATPSYVLISFLAGKLGWLNAPVWMAGVLSVRDSEYDGIKGPVAKVITRSAFYQSSSYGMGDIEGPVQLNSIHTYDKDGNRTELVTYGERGELIRRERWEYMDGWPRRFFDEEDGKTTDIVFDDWRKGLYTLFILRGIDPNTGLRLAPATATEQESKSDSEGRELETIQYKDGKPYSIMRFTYEVDEWDNWIKRHITIHFYNIPRTPFAPFCVTYRDITYHSIK